MTSPPDGIERAVELAGKAEPTPDEAAFLDRFFADHLRPRSGEDPAAHAARLGTPELFELYRRLRTGADFARPDARVSVPVTPPVERLEAVAARVLSERTPAANSHADFVDVDEEYTPAGRVEATRVGDWSGPSPPAATRGPGRSPETAKPAGRLGAIRRRVSDFVYRRKLAARLVGAAVAVAGLSYGMMYLINRQAHRSAEPVRQMQQRTGAAAEGIFADPSRAPIDNKARPTSPAPEAGSR